MAKRPIDKTKLQCPCTDAIIIRFSRRVFASNKKRSNISSKSFQQPKSWWASLVVLLF